MLACVGDIDSERCVVVAGKRAGGAARFGDIQVRQRDRMPIARQRLRRGLADAAARAGDDCNRFT